MSLHQNPDTDTDLANRLRHAEEQQAQLLAALEQIEACAFGSLHLSYAQTVLQMHQIASSAISVARNQNDVTL